MTPMNIKKILFGSKIRTLFLLIILIASKTILSFAIGLGFIGVVILFSFLINTDMEMTVDGTLNATTWLAGIIAIERVVFFFDAPLWICVIAVLVYLWALILYAVCFKK